MSFRIKFLLILMIAFSSSISSQEGKKVSVSGAFQGTLNYFIKDVKIGAANIPQYEGMPVGADAWLNVNADFGRWRGGVRFDFFHNSNLLNPSSSYTDRGLGIWFLETDFKKLNMEVFGLVYIYCSPSILKYWSWL